MILRPLPKESGSPTEWEKEKYLATREVRAPAPIPAPALATHHASRVSMSKHMPCSETLMIQGTFGLISRRLEYQRSPLRQEELTHIFRLPKRSHTPESFESRSESLDAEDGSAPSDNQSGSSEDTETSRFERQKLLSPFPKYVLPPNRVSERSQH